MRITVVSGKGGVGKSMIASSLAFLFGEKEQVVAVDCDVDTPNLALWMGVDSLKNENIKEEFPISTIQKPVINSNLCRRCGKCANLCNFEALTFEKNAVPTLISYKCEGCGLCEIVCPYGAITLADVNNSELRRYSVNIGFSNNKIITLFEGQNLPGEAESGEVVNKIRKYADEFAEKSDEDEEFVFIQDGAAGIGCPVIASIVGSDYVVIVLEPSKSSFSDMNRVLEVVDSFKIPFGIVINKFDLNQSFSERVKSKFDSNMLGTIGYNREVIENLVELKPVIGNVSKTEVELREIFNKIKSVI